MVGAAQEVGVFVLMIIIILKPNYVYVFLCKMSLLFMTIINFFGILSRLIILFCDIAWFIFFGEIKYL